jgi:hypothetical protein
VILTHDRGLSSNDYFQDFVAKKSQGYKGKFLNTKLFSFLKYKITRNFSIEYRISHENSILHIWSSKNVSEI